MSTIRYLRASLLATGLGLSLMAGVTPALAHNGSVDCGVNPANVDCIRETDQASMQQTEAPPARPWESQAAQN